jgi:hypothetical protein
LAIPPGNKSLFGQMKKKKRKQQPPSHFALHPLVYEQARPERHIRRSTWEAEWDDKAGDCSVWTRRL